MAVIFKAKKMTCVATIVPIEQAKIEMNGDLTKVHGFKYSRILPESIYFVFLRNKTPVLEDSFVRLHFGINFERVFVLSLVEMRNFTGVFICKFCKSNKKYYYFQKFTCMTLESCVTEMSAAYVSSVANGRNTAWRLIDYMGGDEAVSQTYPSNETKRRSSKWLMKAVAHFLFNENNRTRNTSMFEFRNGPTIIFRTPAHFESRNRVFQTEMYHLGQTDHHIFITPDRVFNRHMTYEILILPFSKDFWLALFLLSGAIISCLTVTADGKLTSTSVTSEILFVISVLLEKCEKCSCPLKTSVVRYRIHFSITMSFMLVAIVITNAYKGSLKSDFQIQRPYETEWKNLVDLHNFSYYQITENPECLQNGGFPCESCRVWCDSAKFDCRFHFKVTLRLSIFSLAEISKFSKDNVGSRQILKLWNQFYFICHSKLEHLFLNQQGDTKIAFVTTEDQFEYHWQLLQNYVVENPKLGIPLGHSRGTKEDYLQNAIYLSIPSGLDEHQQLIPTRIKVLLSSGIYWHWEKLQKIISPRAQNTERKIERQTREKKPTPLGFKTSKIEIIFKLLMFGAFISILVFSGEKLSSNQLFNSWRKRRGQAPPNLKICMLRACSSR
ncbi:unnamed protein product [Allacma fusca]|uniref:Uncharacterized protein n=1 Tax=Allacma fusca TaxID=39272 RepID=A0A8J2KBD0_9HEXA|nr:unnamed protein product [Allacma fusca]